MAEIGGEKRQAMLRIRPLAIGIGQGVDGEAVAIMRNSA